jgi:hypothetical protein
MSERIRPIRLLEIDFGAVAHRAMWGYGVDPPADMNPPVWVWCRACQPDPAGAAADGDMVFMALYSGVSALLNRPVPRGVELTFAAPVVSAGLRR